MAIVDVRIGCLSGQVVVGSAEIQEGPKVFGQAAWNQTYSRKTYLKQVRVAAGKQGGQQHAKKLGTWIANCGNELGMNIWELGMNIWDPGMLRWTEQGKLADNVVLSKDGNKGCWKILLTVPPDIVSPIAFRIWFYKMFCFWLLLWSLFTFCLAQKQEGVDKDVVVWKQSV